MAKKKQKQTARPRCVCGAFADLYFLPSRKAQGLNPWVDASCKKCLRLAVDAQMVPGGALKFIDQFEMEWEEYDISEDEAAAAIFTDRCRRVDIGDEVYLMAIFKIEFEHGWDWFAQPIPYPEE